MNVLFSCLASFVLFILSFFLGSLSSAENLEELLLSQNEVEVLDRAAFRGLFQVLTVEKDKTGSFEWKAIA